MVKTRTSLLPNISLALLLIAIVGSWFWSFPQNIEVLVGYSLLTLTTLGLVYFALQRPPARYRDERWWVFLICAVSMTYAFGYRFDQTSPQLKAIFWGRISLQFIAGTALLSLGKSYALLPALREVRRGFLYRYVRHPVYAMYILADLIVVLLQPSLWNVGIAVIGASAFFLRATLEERVLAYDPIYANYMGVVRWRFFPGVH
jgi:protein-S-isoprenylcysteine O-methyltransferase Ste14